MSVAKALKQQEQGKKKGRGSVNNKHRLGAFAASSESHGADWGACSPEKLQGVIEGITRLGGAVIFGLSRDGGAYSVTLLLDKDKAALWFNADADVNQELDNVMGTLEAMD
ncbi:hypothetical protein LCGC14_2674590 [marine sediment metagenome]|uniref:Uncharacterized protein n=1 Tax=marine sediment metagenome TaxID=412755 RepID=A0A0F8ZN41_9ZZZZ